MKSKIRKARLLALMTQVQVAEAVGVSQPTYQRWESGSASVPKSKTAKLAKVLGITVQQVEGQPEPFDLFGINKGVSDERKYYGELAIHFVSGSPPLLLPISEAECSRFYNAVQGSDAFIELASLDNRIVFVRRKAIADAYLSSDDYDDYGPEDYGQQHLGVHPEDEFWKIIGHLECLECLDDEFSEREIQAVTRKVLLNDADLDELIANGSIKPEDRTNVKQKAHETAELYVSRARDITWQLHDGRSRCISCLDNKDLYEAFCNLWCAEEQELFYLAPAGHHRSIFVCLSALDFIAVPAHKYREGELESAAEEIDEAD